MAEWGAPSQSAIACGKDVWRHVSADPMDNLDINEMKLRN